MKKNYMPPNYVDKFGVDIYKQLTGIDSTEEEKHYKNPVAYARAMFEKHKLATEQNDVIQKKRGKAIVAAEIHKRNLAIPTPDIYEVQL